MNNSQTNPLSRWHLTLIPPTIPKEIAIIPCGGCQNRRKTLSVSDAVCNNLRPHLAFRVSIPSLYWSHLGASRLRTLQADGVIALAGCEHNCPAKVLDNVRSPDRIIQVYDESDEAEVGQLVARYIDELAGVEPISVETPLFIPPAAQANGRRFAPPAQARQPSVSGTRRYAPSVRPAGEVAESAIGRRTDYFGGKTKSSSAGWLFFLLLILVGAGGWYTWDMWGPKVLALIQGQDQQESPYQLLSEQPSPTTPEPGQPAQPEPSQVAAGDQEPAAAPDQAEPAAAPDQAPEPAAAPDQAEPVAAAPDQNEPEAAPDPIKPKTPPSQVAAVAPKPTPAQTPGIDLTHASQPSSYDIDSVNAGWIGGQCEDTSDCGFEFGQCLKSVGMGYCTRACIKFCPDKEMPGTEFTISRCIDAWYLAQRLPEKLDSKFGYCVAECNFDIYPKTGCRQGAICQAMPPRWKRDLPFEVCIPVAKK